jgi:DNA polymerase-1
MILSPNTPEAYKLLHRGALALADVEMNGIRVDIDHCRDEQRKARMTMAEIEGLIREMDEGKIWAKKFKSKGMNIGSQEQLADVLFKYSEYERVKGNSTDQDVLAEIGTPFTDAIARYRKYSQAAGTFLEAIIRQVDENGLLHPGFALNTTQTFRSSSMDPNFQNMPIHDHEIGPLIRRGIISRKGRQLVELDYSGAEVSNGVCYHKDPTMVRYITDPSKDMHRDMAMECFKLPLDEITKKIRFIGKNDFVFPQFYGDYYKTCADSMWKDVRRQDLELQSGKPLISHMKSVGLGTYNLLEGHLEDVEEAFWSERFPVYARWKKKMYKQYLRDGFVHTLTGFTVQGFMRKNQVINYPVQGSAFHWLLWSLTELNRQMRRNQMSSMIVGQVHDSMLLDCHPRETDDVIHLAREIMTKRIMKQWDWILVPLVADAEIAPINGSWHEKAEY